MSNQLDELVDFKQIVLKVYRNWFLILFSLIFSFIVASIYNRYSTEFFLCESSVLIQEDNSTLPTASELIYENKSYNKRKLSKENKALVLKSYPLVFKTLSDLRFDIGYFIEGNIKVTESYDAPISIACSNDIIALYGKSLKIVIIDENRFSIIDISNKNEQIRSFNEKFLFHGIELVVKYNIDFPADKIDDLPVTVVKFRSLQSLTLTFQNSIVVKQKERESSVLNVSILSEDERKGVVFLNKLIENYIAFDINEKNLASHNTVKFINNQLNQMSDSLALIEMQMQEYKNNNQITDLSVKAQNIYSNIVSLERASSKLKTTNKYYNYLSDYLSKGDYIEGVSVPVSFGVDDVALNSLISKLIEVQTKKNILIDGGQVNNPAISKYNRQRKQLIINIKEAINSSKSANELMLADNRKRISILESSLKSIPEVEMELLNIERLRSISESIYVFLLQKRAEARISAASNVSDSKILEPAVFLNRNPVSPDRRETYLIALLLGLLIPIIFILLLELINDKILTRADLKRLTNIPVLSIIGKNFSGYELLSQLSPKSVFFEGFRVLRSNLGFFPTSKTDKVFLVTSSVGGEGKTYVASNLAIVLAKSGKKTLLIGADLRKPKIYSSFGLNNSKGISSYIFSESEIFVNDLISESNVEHLDILLSGPMPVNPSDALLTDKFSDMIDQLKKKYDFIVLDTPPLGLVSDALTLMYYSDVNLYIVRQGYTRKGLLSYINDLFDKQMLGNVQILFNDVDEGAGAYAYAYGYSGYGYNSAELDYFDNDKKIDK